MYFKYNINIKINICIIYLYFKIIYHKNIKLNFKVFVFKQVYVFENKNLIYLLCKIIYSFIYWAFSSSFGGSTFCSSTFLLSSFSAFVAVSFLADFPPFLFVFLLSISSNFL